METETIDKLFLELSQVTNARTAKELKLLKLLNGVHSWFIQKAPEHYKGCGLFLDVQHILRSERMIPPSDGI